MKVSISCNRNLFLLSLLIIFVLTCIYYATFNTLHSDVIKSKSRIMSTPEVITIARNPSTVNTDKVSDSGFLLNQEIKGATVIRRTESAWSPDDGSCDGDQSVVKTQLHSPAGNTPIYIHPSKADIWVSGSVEKGGVWEQGTVAKFYRILKDRPDLQFIDIGANIGVYGLTMAKLGRKVLMVEPLLTNVQKLCHSVRDGNFQDVYVLHNALSSRRFNVGFGVYKGNIGGTYVRNVTSDKEEKAYAILLDDLLGVFHFTKVAIKLDVETHEGQVLAGGDNFFTNVDVQYLMLEWHGDKKTTGKGILDFLARHKMSPFHPDNDKTLDPNDFKNWPGDVLWKKSA